ncbi:MAG: hypothetical protein K8U57_27205 [Planctomycetes bacterium]|nr:hypothetical protein [Planctomycetota bacterium]
MRRLAVVIALGLLAVIPDVGSNAKAQPPVAYVAPKADGPVLELLDDSVGPILPVLNNDGGGDLGIITREDRDVFAGVEAIRITPNQRYCSRIPGWNFRIVEKPKDPGEFRYLRFAWKKVGGTGIMIQLHDPAKSWHQRYFAGRNVFAWQPAISVSEKLPVEWELVTCDLFKDGGASTLSGIALTALDGTAALYDHMLLGRTVEDLDKATDAALGKVKPKTSLEGKERDALWADLLALDAKKASAALRLFLATSTDQVGFIRERLADVTAKDGSGQIYKLIRDLDSDSFETRQTATEELIKLGAPVVDAVREAGRTTTSDEVRFRVRIIMKQLGGGAAGVAPVGKAACLSRVVRVLERAATPDARTLLAEIAEGKLAPECSTDAKAALARLPKLP